jgi:dienelactone hydrolase
MRLSTFRRVATGILFLAVLSLTWQARGEDSATESRQVSKTYNNAPFTYQSRLKEDREQFKVFRLTYPSPVVTSVEANNTVPALYYVPKNLVAGAKYPAVICLHILNGDEQLVDLVCSVLAKRGIPALSFKLPYYGERSPKKGPDAMTEDPRLMIGSLSQAVEDIRRTVDLLASRDEVNPDHVGITGISLGGITGATAAGAEPRIYRAALMLAGGDLLPVIRQSRETSRIRRLLDSLSPEERKKVEESFTAVDPLQFAPKLRDRALQGRVMMLNAGNDEVIPRPCTEKLAQALGIADKVIWFEGLGHYTAMVELPRALRLMADFFAQDLPAEAQTAKIVAPAKPSTATQRLVRFVDQIVTMMNVEPGDGRCHFVDLDVAFQNGNSKEMKSQLRLVRGAKGRFSLSCDVPMLGEIAVGQGDYPWMLAGKKNLVVGTKNPKPKANMVQFVDPQHLMRLRMIAGVGGGIVLAPDMLQQWVAIEDVKSSDAKDGDQKSNAIKLAAKDKRKVPGDVQIAFAEDGRTPSAITFSVLGVKGKVTVRGWQTNSVAPKELFNPPEGIKRTEVDETDLNHMMAAIVNVAGDRLDDVRRDPNLGKNPDEIAILARDPAGHGMLCRNQGKRILLVSGTPEQMGAAQGTLVGGLAKRMTERAVYLVGGADTLRSGEWFFNTMSDIERRTTPHIPPRFFAECDALAKATGISQRDARYANLFPERFHCSGVAVRGKASAGGRVLHARVLDYMRDIDLQEAAVLTVFMPEGHYKWVSHGYAGFIGTVTCMNEKGLAIGEMGGRGEGHWDGLPMTLLLRDIMERASTVDEAVEIFQKTPRTCEYYYVVSDKSGDMVALGCKPEKVEILKPGQQDPRLAYIPEDTVLISAPDRIKHLSDRVQANYGKIDVAKMIEIIKRPVAMNSNLHDAIFAPETLEVWFSDAGKHTLGCDEPYAHVKLDELIQFYDDHIKVEPKK